MVPAMYLLLSVAATDNGRRATGRGGSIGARSALWQPDPADFGRPEVIARRNRATSVPAARRRPGKMAARRSSWRAPPRRAPHPHAGGRSDGTRAAEWAGGIATAARKG